MLLIWEHLDSWCQNCSVFFENLSKRHLLPIWLGWLVLPPYHHPCRPSTGKVSVKRDRKSFNNSQENWLAPEQMVSIMNNTWEKKFFLFISLHHISSFILISLFTFKFIQYHLAREPFPIPSPFTVSNFILI